MKTTAKTTRGHDLDAMMERAGAIVDRLFDTELVIGDEDRHELHLAILDALDETEPTTTKEA